MTQRASARPSSLLHLGWLLGALLLAGCAAAPVQEMSDARQAIDAAVAAGAEQRSPQLLQDAQRSLQKAEKSLKGHQFRMARRHAVEARASAIEAQGNKQGGTASPASATP